jgi:Raf kinase inhibitor-like YbhB/YbcL family protein
MRTLNMAFGLKSSVFQANQSIPKKYTCDGSDVSVPLTWSDPPAGTRSFAMIADDPDAPRGTWVHWVIYDLPSSVKDLAEGVPTREKLENGGKQGKNDFGKIGYGGPCPPAGPAHHYHFRLYALADQVRLEPGATKQQLLDAMKGHILSQAELVGTYKR